MQKGKLVFKNLDAKRLGSVEAAELVLRQAGVRFTTKLSKDQSSCEWIIDEDASGIELEVEKEPVIINNCTCPCMNCCKTCCPHRQEPYWRPYIYPYDTSGTTWYPTYIINGGYNG